MSTYTETPKVMDTSLDEATDHEIPTNMPYLQRYSKGDRISTTPPEGVTDGVSGVSLVETSSAPATLVQENVGSIVYYLDFDANFQELATTRLMIF